MPTPAPPAHAHPSRGRRTSRPSGDDRELAILQTAERLLEERPLAEISVDDLARGAGISRPTFYFYFASKNAVLLTLVDHVVQEVDSATDGNPALLARDPAGVWRRGIEAIFEAFTSHRAVARAGAAALASDPEVRAVWSTLMRKWIRHTTALISAERDRGVAPETIPAADLATSLNLMNERIMLAAFSADPQVADDDVVDTLTHIWLTSIYGTAP